MTKTSTVRYEDDSFAVTIKVKQATVLDALVQSALEHSMEVRTVEALLPETVRSLTGLIWWVQTAYCACRSLTVSVENDEGKEKLSADLSMKEFLEIPEALQNVWWTAIIRLNPQIMPTPVTPKTAETVDEAKNV